MDPFTFFAKGTWPLINAVITQLDTEAFKLLVNHENKIICFHIEQVTPIYFQIQSKGLTVIELTDNQHIDLTFSGPLSAFMSMIFTQNRLNHGLHVKGDIECAKALYDTWHHIDLDWEGALAQWVGPHVAHGIGTGLASATQWARETFEARTEDLAAYLQDEGRYLPNQSEVDALCKEIDALRNDVERFQAKLILFEQRLETM